MTPETLVCTVIESQLGLSGRVAIYNNRWQPPNDTGAYVTVAVGDSRVIGTTSQLDSETEEEVQSVSMHTTLEVELSSVNNEARALKPHLLSALRGFYAQQLAEENGMAIFRPGTVLDLSAIEGARALEKYRFSVVVAHVERRRIAADFYDQIQAPEVTTCQD